MDLVGVKVLCESAVIHLWKNMLHRSMLLSDHTLLRILYREGLMSNVLICRYLHCTEFWFSRVVQPHTEITTQAQYINCNIQLDHNRNTIAIIGLHMLTTTALGGVPSCEEGIHALKPAQAHCSFQNSSCWSLGFYTSIRLSYIYTSLLPLPSPPRCTTQWPTGAAVYLKQRSPSRPTCVEVRSAFFMIISSHSLRSSLSSSFLSISSDALVVICWLVTSPCNETG